MDPKILLSVDMDEWYQCRWATGSRYAIWPDTQACFRDYYGADEPSGEIIPLTERIITMFHEVRAPATFFFTGEIANRYPDLVKQIADSGFEVGCHNWTHQDYSEANRSQFYGDVTKARALLQQLSGQEVLGYRAPNSTVASYMIQDLIKAGFRYDSSITPTRPLMGKFGRFETAPLNPYQLSATDFATPGTSGLWEFPWPVFPAARLPSGSGITSRLAGYHYTKRALDNALRTGDSAYYFHPYEIGARPHIARPGKRARIFMHRMGTSYERMLRRLLQRYKGRFESGAGILERHTS